MEAITSYSSAAGIASLVSVVSIAGNRVCSCQTDFSGGHCFTIRGLLLNWWNGTGSRHGWMRHRYPSVADIRHFSLKNLSKSITRYSQCPKYLHVVQIWFFQLTRFIIVLQPIYCTGARLADIIFFNRCFFFLTFYCISCLFVFEF